MTNSALVYRSFGPPDLSLKLEQRPLSARPDAMLRVKMIQVPVNPSDLIPVTGAYAHRITLPCIAGYEGVGRVVDAPSELASLTGQRVLPLRGPGTWQSFVDCNPEMAIPVPENIRDDIAARAYINPMAASEMLRQTSASGKRVLLSGAGSFCADLLGHLARQQGAADVTGIFRSQRRTERLHDLGITPVSIHDRSEILRLARLADITFDSLGGPVASLILDNMRQGSRFVGYGLLSGQPVRPSRLPRAEYLRFHLRDRLADMDASSWQQAFRRIWPVLESFPMPSVREHPLENWRNAILQTRSPGAEKPVLSFQH